MEIRSATIIFFADSCLRNPHIMMISRIEQLLLLRFSFVKSQQEEFRSHYFGSSNAMQSQFIIGLVTFIIVTMPFHNTQYIMGYNIMAQPHGLTMSL